jgi:hypothetical protein
MKKPTRRPFLRPVGIPTGLSAGGDSQAAIDGQSRRAFLQGTAGAAAGAAAFLVIPKAASVASTPRASTSTAPAPVVTKRSGAVPPEPVTAYVHNADRHEVVVMWGQNEVTFKDPALVKRLLDATR